MVYAGAQAPEPAAGLVSRWEAADSARGGECVYSGEQKTVAVTRCG